MRVGYNYAILTHARKMKTEENTMRKKLFQKAICLVLSVATLLGAIAVTSFASSEPVRTPAGNSTVAPSLSEMQDVAGIGSYEKYLQSYIESENGSAVDYENPIIVYDAEKEGYNGNYTVNLGSNGLPAVNTVDKAEEALGWQKWDGYTEGFADPDKAGNALYLSSTGDITWTVKIEDNKGGWYKIVFEYYSCNTEESSNSAIERKLLINGKVPFSEVGSIRFDKFWSYDNYEEIPANDARRLPRLDIRADGIYYQYVTTDSSYSKYVVEVKNGVAQNIGVYVITQDINGNSMSPELKVSPKWSTYECCDSTGYYDESFGFYFVNNQSVTISLEAIREPLVIKSVKLVPLYEENEAISYEDYLNSYADKTKYPDNSANGNMVQIEAEFPNYVSDSAVSPSNDKTSAATYPTTSKAQLYNIIGKKSYNSVGQWSAYSFRVTESGFYNLGMRFKQDALQGMYICRAIKLTGGQYGTIPTVPFAEANDIRFNYSKDWQSAYLGAHSTVEGEDGTTVDPFEFYFEAGVEYTLYLECSLGSLKEQIKRVEDALNTVNSAYLTIIQLTGSDPDEYRDYDFIDTMPQVLVRILEAAEELMKVKDELEKLCGTNGAHIATLETVAITFNRAASNEGYNLAANLSSLKSYLGTLGTWVSSSKSGAMTVDSITVLPAGSDEEKLPEAGASFFQSLWYEISSFVYSFFTDYEQMGLTTVPDENTTTIDVWLDKGRDQSQIWRSMVDKNTGFTAKTGIAVTLKLVAGGTLLPSILSGKGPDVYMELDSASVINYAIRGAIVSTNGNITDDMNMTERDRLAFTSYAYGDDIYKNRVVDADGKITLSGLYKFSGSGKLEGIDETKKITLAAGTFVSEPYAEALVSNVTGESLYADAAMDTLQLLNFSYGIPMTMNFSMMFYRMDVLADLGESIPKTWGELLAMLPNLQSNSMSIGISYVAALDFMIYQMGGNLWKYTDNPTYAGAKINYDSDIALNAFNYVCRWYTDHSFPVTYDAANRFRTGEMPILVGDYTSLYNQLIVFATEIQGLWGFCPLPGVETKDEKGDTVINYDSLAGVRATVMLAGCDDKLGAWKFMQWQTSADVQAEYGNGMVAIIGPSAKYEAANLETIEDLSWTAEEKIRIMDQIKNMSSIVNYPGSYIIARYTNFAFLEAVNDKVDPVSALQNYIPAINTELKRKREEFDLAVLEPNQEPGDVITTD